MRFPGEALRSVDLAAQFRAGTNVSYAENFRQFLALRKKIKGVLPSPAPEGLQVKFRNKRTFLNALATEFKERQGHLEVEVAQVNALSKTIADKVNYATGIVAKVSMGPCSFASKVNLSSCSFVYHSFPAEGKLETDRNTDSKTRKSSSLRQRAVLTAIELADEIQELCPCVSSDVVINNPRSGHRTILGGDRQRLGDNLRKAGVKPLAIK
jgi:hypothetical protein